MQSILKSQKRINLAIDGGDFEPDSKVHSGVQRVADSFLKNIPDKSLNFIHIYYFYFGKKTFPSVSKAGYILHLIRLPRRFYARIFLPFVCIFYSTKTYISFSGYTPKILKYFHIKTISFIYDVGFFKYPDLYRNKKHLLSHISSSIKNSNVTVTLTEYAKRDIHYFFPQKKVVVLRPGLDHIKKSKKEAKDINYFLYIGVIKQMKNIKKLIELYDRYESKNKSSKLILIGKKEKGYFQEILQMKEYIRNKANIQFLENVSDEDLSAYIQRAKALLNTSLEEGFGFPVLEALSLEVPVIVNNLKVYQEFLEYKNLYVTKTDSEFIQKMRTISYFKETIQIRTWKEFVVELLRLA